MVYLALKNGDQAQNNIDIFEKAIKAFDLLLTSQATSKGDMIELAVDTKDVNQARLVTNLAFDWFDGDLLGWRAGG